MKKLIFLGISIFFMATAGYAQNPFVLDKPASVKQEKASNGKWPSTPPPPPTSASSLASVPEVPVNANASKWEVQGRVDDSVILTNSKGETRIVAIGDEIEGCKATAERLICDPTEKKTVEKKDKDVKEVEVMKKAVSNQAIQIVGLEKDLAKSNKKHDDYVTKTEKEIAQGNDLLAALKAKDTEIRELTAKLTGQNQEMLKFRDAVAKKDIIITNLKELKKELRIGLPDKSSPLAAVIQNPDGYVWTKAKNQQMGLVMITSADSAMIVRVERNSATAARNVFKGLVLDSVEHGAFAYLAVLKDHVQVDGLPR